MPEDPENPTGSGAIARELPVITSSRSAPCRPTGGVVVPALKVSAWINLIACAVASCYVFRELGVGLIFEVDFLEYAERVVNPFGVILSLALFLQAIFGFVFFPAVASALENIISIHKILTGSRENFT